MNKKYQAKGKSVSMYLPLPAVAQLERLAESSGRSKSEVVAGLIMAAHRPIPRNTTPDEFSKLIAQRNQLPSQNKNNNIDAGGRPCTNCGRKTP